jgi:hypothetical protein
LACAVWYFLWYVFKITIFVLFVSEPYAYHA